MKNNSRVSFTKYLSLFVLLAILMLAGCGKQSSSGKDSKASTYVPDTGLAEYNCETEIAIDELIYVQLDINPSFILGMTKEYKVVSIVANNDDAEDVMLNCMKDYFAEVSGGVELENVIHDLAQATKEGGYIEDTFDVSVTVLSGDVKESAFEQVFDWAATELAENDGIEASIDNFTIETEIYTENQNNDNSSGEPGNDNSSGDPVNDDNSDDSIDNMSDEEDNTCDLCHGECTIVCDLCNGECEITEIEEREVRVRNNYVCPYCGGVGILDDGLHGGQKAVCGHCGGEGKTGPISGDFNELAYDTEIIEEEVIRPCPRCDGSGILPCPHCEGTGVI